MKLGLISDVHADLNGLTLALDVLRQQQVDQIVCAGDLVEKGTDGDAVVQIIKTLQIPSARGNHDYDAIGNQEWLRKNVDKTHPGLRGRLLKEETINFLKELPRSLNFTIENIRIFVTHGAPWSDVVYVFPTSRRGTFERVAAEAQAIRSQIVILGHTHTPMAARVDNIQIYNPGSVCGIQSSGSRSCAVLTLPECKYEVFGIKTGEPLAVTKINLSNLP